MKDKIREAIKTARTLDDIELHLCTLFKQITAENTVKKLGMVCGIITSDGLQHVMKNIAILDAYTKYLKTKHSFPLFSLVDVFSDELIEKIRAKSFTSDDWILFCRNVIIGGHISDIFMTPRWRKSTGAIDEYHTAKKLGLTVHHVRKRNIIPTTIEKLPEKFY